MNEKILVPISIPLTVTQKRNDPALEIRKLLTDPEIIKQLVSAAHNEQPIIIQPYFTKKLESINRLIDKGIIYRDSSDGKFYFTY